MTGRLVSHLTACVVAPCRRSRVVIQSVRLSIVVPRLAVIAIGCTYQRQQARGEPYGSDGAAGLLLFDLDLTLVVVAGATTTWEAEVGRGSEAAEGVVAGGASSEQPLAEIVFARWLVPLQLLLALDGPALHPCARNACASARAFAAPALGRRLCQILLVAVARLSGSATRIHGVRAGYGHGDLCERPRAVTARAPLRKCWSAAASWKVSPTAFTNHRGREHGMPVLCRNI